MNKQTNIKFRPADKEDYEFVHKAHHASYYDVVIRQFGKWEIKTQDKFFESSWKKFPYEIILIKGKQCGYLSIEETNNLVILHELVLLPEFQGQGIGSTILSEFITKAKKNNTKITLQVLKKNSAQELYRRLGFMDIGETDTHFKMEYNPLLQKTK
jgi:ribosomal protein S18 acetylase RimI-like enzyme